MVEELKDLKRILMSHVQSGEPEDDRAMLAWFQQELSRIVAKYSDDMK